MALMSPERTSAGGGRTIVLLGARKSGKSRLLASVLARDDAVLLALELEGLRKARIGYCSHNELLHSHLTAEDNLRLAAAVAGVEAWQAQLALLLPDAPWAAAGKRRRGERMRAALLPRAEARLLALATALLGDPPLLLIDDLGRGLSRPAQKELWRRLGDLQKRAPRLIIYATGNLHAARRLGADVWLLEGGAVQARWAASALPAALEGVQAYGLTMKRAQEAQRLAEQLQALPLPYCAIRDDGLTVDVVTDERPTLLELASAAGAGLTRFAALPPEVDKLPHGWYVEAEAENGDVAEQLSLAGGTYGGAAERNEARLVALLAWCTWRRAYRDGTRVVWSLVSNALLLMLLLVVMSNRPEGLPASWWLLQAVAATPALVWAARAARYWRRTSAMETLFAAAQLDGRGSSLTLLRCYLLSGGSKATLTAGVGSGVLLVSLTYGALFQLMWLLWLRQGGASPIVALATIGAWLALSVVFVGLGLALDWSTEGVIDAGAG